MRSAENQPVALHGNKDGFTPENPGREDEGWNVIGEDGVCKDGGKMKIKKPSKKRRGPKIG